MDYLRHQLLARSWIGFDLDDTLHEFRRASRAATNEILNEISSRYGIPYLPLEEEYYKILKLKTANAFSDGKTSFEYRKERFTSLLNSFSLPSDDEPAMTAMLELYEDTLTKSLKLKLGAIDLLSTIKRLGKNIVIITEGPHDAQERTLQALGIIDHVDFLATTNEFQLAKPEGLFSKVLTHLQISAEEMAYIGDCEARDIIPATGQGILTIHLDEANQSSLDAFPPRINSLEVLQGLLANTANH